MSDRDRRLSELMELRGGMKKCKHKWENPQPSWQPPIYGPASYAVCSKCGIRYDSYLMWESNEPTQEEKKEFFDSLTKHLPNKA